MLLLLFGGGGGGIPAPDFTTLISTAPTASQGYVVQRAAPSGAWRFALELADPAALVWHDITQFYAGDRHQFGADDYKGRARARLVSVQLQTDDDMLAPWGQDTTPLFGVNVTLDAGLVMRASMTRVVSGVVVEWQPLWTGRVESWGDASAARGQIRTHVISVVDSISDLANVPTVIEALSDWWRDWFTEQLLPAAGWSWGVDIYGSHPDDGLPQDLDIVAAINRMDQGTDPLGLVWRSLRSGRMVIHPAPWDTTNAERYANPLLDVYPGGLVFSYSPDVTEIEYIADDDQQPFGISRTNAGVLNYFLVTMQPGDILTAIDDPVSIDRYGVRPYQASWIISNPAVVDDMLASRAYATSQALPLRTTLDHEGFWPALAMVDHLDPVTVVHQTAADGLVVTGTGTIRNVVEERTWRGAGLLAWQSTVQIDIDSTETAEALLPVEELAFTGSETSPLGGPSTATFSWVDPVQPSVTPTNVQYRVIGRSLIWTTAAYPGVGADGATVNWLEAATTYRFQVRLIRQENGVVTAFSAIREIIFTTAALILPVPTPGEDPGDTDVIGTPPDDDCDDFEIDLQENDGTGWVTVDNFTGAELTPNGDGTYRLTTPIPNSFFNDGSVYRFRSSCDGITWINGPSFDPPDNWDAPCTTPPALSTSPYDDPTLLVYVPQICAPDIIREAVSGIEAVKGDAYLEILSGLADPDARALKAIPSPEWDATPGGIVAYGECPQIVGATGDKSLSIRVNVADDTVDCVLFECAAMTLKAVAVGGGGWRAVVIVYLPGSTITVPSVTVLNINTAYELLATRELATGNINLYIDGVIDASLGGSDNVPTINALPIWRVGAPPESWLTDAALWDSVIVPGPPPGGALPPAILALTPLSYWTLRGDDADTLTDFGTLGHDLTNSGAMTLDNSAGEDGFNYPQKTGSDSANLNADDDINYEPQHAAGLTVFYLVKGKAGGDAGGSYVTVCKQDQTSVGSWRQAISTGTPSGSLVRTITAGGLNARSRTDTGTQSIDTWHLMIARYSGSATGFPGLRIDGVNITGATGGSGTAVANSSQRVRLYGHGGLVGRFQGTLAHVAIFAGQLSDADCITLETAAGIDGW